MDSSTIITRSWYFQERTVVYVSMQSKRHTPMIFTKVDRRMYTKKVQSNPENVARLTYTRIVDALYCEDCRIDEIDYIPQCPQRPTEILIFVQIIITTITIDWKM